MCLCKCKCSNNNNVIQQQQKQQQQQQQQTTWSAGSNFSVSNSMHVHTQETFPRKRAISSASRCLRAIFLRRACTQTHTHTFSKVSVKIHLLYKVSVLIHLLFNVTIQDFLCALPLPTPHTLLPAPYTCLSLAATAGRNVAALSLYI
jgi:hypothetical protein